MAKKPLVSVIIPSTLDLDRKQYIHESLNSVLKQSLKDFEIIVVHNGSDKKNKSILKPFKKIKYIYTKKGNLGNARNLGVKAAKGEYIAFTDDDDICEKDRLKLQVKALKDNPDIDFISADTSFFNENGIIHKSYFKTLENFRKLKWIKRPNNVFVESQSLTDYLLLEDPFFPVSWTGRRDLFKKHQSNQYFNGQDWDFLLRISSKATIGFIGKPLVKVRKHTLNMSGPSKWKRRYNCYISIITDYMKTHELTKNQKINAKTTLARFYFEFGYHYLEESKKIGRELLCKSLSTRCTFKPIKAYITSFLPNPLISALRTIKNRII